MFISSKVALVSFKRIFHPSNRLTGVPGHVEQLLQSATQNGVRGDVEPSHTICLARYGESDELADLEASTTSLLHVPPHHLMSSHS